MGLFAPTPKITPEEWDDIRRRLSSKHVPHSILEEIDQLLDKALTETKGGQPGIDKKEFRRIIDQLKRHPERHKLTPEQVETVIDALEDEL